MNHDIFISYSSIDQKVAFEICHVLEQNDLKCWIAPRDIPKGNYYATELVHAIDNSKLFVLVFSKNSQQSSHVLSELQRAFEKEIPILSFNLTEEIPKDEMNYFLKITQWLAGYPKPEDNYHSLIENALRLCDKDFHRPIHFDLSGFDSKYISTLKKDYPSLILLFTPLYWASFIYMGLTADEKLWTLSGLIYLIPSIVCIIFYYQIWGYLFIYYNVFSLFFKLFLIFWILAVLHGLLIRNEFLTKHIVLRLASVDDDYYDSLLDEYSKI